MINLINVIFVILIGIGFPMTFSKKRLLRVCSLWLVTKGEFLKRKQVNCDNIGEENICTDITRKI